MIKYFKGPVLRSWLLISVSNQRNQGFLEKWLILGLGQGTYKMSLEHLVCQKSKEVLKKQSNRGHVKDTQEPV